MKHFGNPYEPLWECELCVHNSLSGKREKITDYVHAKSKGVAKDACRWIYGELIDIRSVDRAE